MTPLLSEIDQRRPPALAGIKVLDLTAVMSGPYCTRTLADLGADVIKIEPVGGELGRASAPLRGGRSTVFGALNCGKRSMVLDLKQPDDFDLVRSLACEADILVENFRPGVMDRLGLGYAELSAMAPTLIYCSISGFGQGGPLAGFPSYAPIVHAMSGYDMAHFEYQDDAERPANTGIFMADAMGGANAASAILAALFERTRSGRGQHVGATLFDAMQSMMVREVQEAQLPPVPRRHLYKPLPALDGHVIAMPLSPRNFEGLCRAIGRPELLTDPRYGSPADRAAHWDELMQVVAEWTAGRTADEGESDLLATGVPAARYRTMRQAMADPVLAKRDIYATIPAGDEQHLITKLPFSMSATPPEPTPWVAEPDAHGDAIRAARGFS